MLLRRRCGLDDGSDGLLEDLLEALLGQGRALQVAIPTDLPRQLQALSALDRAASLCRQRLQLLSVVPQVDLRP